MSCEICIETYNKSNRICVKCDLCGYESCINCCKTFILQQSDYIHCMNCKREWSLNKLVKTFPKTFINKEYKELSMKILFEKEQTLLPQTQNYLLKLENKQRVKEQIRDIDEQIKRLTELKNNLKQQLQNDILMESNNKYIQKCTNQDCRGYLNTNWKCDMCDTTFCSECKLIKMETQNHVCDKQTLESIQLIEKETKACPKCDMRIYKTDGCDQMWCTQCHTAFSWRTGKIETNIHNPHYYEYMQNVQNLQRNPLEVQCGREIDDHFLNVLHRTLTVHYITNGKIAKDIATNIFHMQLVFPDYINKIKDNQDLRVKYLKNQITLDKFKSMLYRRSNKINKKREIINLLAMYIHCITDILYRFMNDMYNNGNFNFTPYLKEINSLINYVNDCLSIIHNTYGGTVKYISEYGYYFF